MYRTRVCALCGGCWSCGGVLLFFVGVFGGFVLCGFGPGFWVVFGVCFVFCLWLWFGFIVLL